MPSFSAPANTFLRYADMHRGNGTIKSAIANYKRARTQAKREKWAEEDIQVITDSIEILERKLQRGHVNLLPC